MATEELVLEASIEPLNVGPIPVAHRLGINMPGGALDAGLMAEPFLAARTQRFLGGVRKAKSSYFTSFGFSAWPHYFPFRPGSRPESGSLPPWRSICCGKMTLQELPVLG